MGLAGCLLAGSLAAAPAEAAYPGKPGRIAFTYVFTDSFHPIVTVKPDGSGRQTLTSGTPGDESTAHSPNGKLIAFSRDTGPLSNELWVMNDDGSGERQLTANAMNLVFESQPAFSPNGQRIAFTHSDGGSPEILSIGVDGGAVTPLTDDPVTTARNPVYLPDGRIVFTRSGGVTNDDLWIMEGDGSNERPLLVASGSQFNPDTSADGRQIVFDGGDGIYIARSDGTGATKVPGTGAYFEAPRFSPDGSRLLIQLFDPMAMNTDLLISRLDGSGVRNLTPTPSNSELGQSWQPIPVPCAKRRSTIVGTAGRDQLVGTPKRDVIAGLGGRDRIRGLGGNDRLCGGRGRDRLIGGKGKDRLHGQAGKDRLSGGPRKDVCIGGAKEDRAAGCELTRSL